MIKRFLVQYSTLLNLKKFISTTFPQTLFHRFTISIINSRAKSYTELPMDPTLTIEPCDELRSKAHKICSNHLGGVWSKASPHEISLIPISGGMSNLLYRCSLPESTMIYNNEPSQVLLRLYGDHLRDEDMSIQIDIFNMLSLRELGPKLYGEFGDGRLEEFLPATSLTCDELKDDEISAIIAKKLAIVHSLDVSLDQTNNWIIDRMNDFSDFKELPPPTFNDDSRHSTKEIANELLAIDFDREIKYVIGVCNKSKSPLVFSHNDLHQGNILLAEYSKRRPNLKERIVFIDFEYCSYNYRGFDIANHFCEWCFEYDTPEYPHFKFSKNEFPTRDIQRNFIRHYTDQSKQLTSLRKDTLVKNGVLKNKSNSYDVNNNGSSNGHFINGHSNGFMKETEEDKLLNEAQPFFMTANLLWTLWCINKAHRSTGIKFGYWEHAMVRWRLYQGFKQSYIDAQKSRSNNAS